MTKNNGNNLTLTTFWLKELLVSVNKTGGWMIVLNEQIIKER